MMEKTTALALLLLALPAIIYCAVSFSVADVPACFAVSRLAPPQPRHEKVEEEGQQQQQQQRIVVVGDVHGDLVGLLEVLHAANVTRSADECAWTPSTPTLLVQTGDVVDRGPDVLGVLACLDTLQGSAPAGSRVVRTIGNHDLWWLEGMFDYRNKGDTPAVRADAVRRLRRVIASGGMVGAFAHWVQGVPLLFVHAGVRPAMLTYISSQLAARGGAGRALEDLHRSDVARAVADYVNGKVHETMENTCPGSGGSGSGSGSGSGGGEEETVEEVPTCSFTDPVFLAGPERGNKQPGVIGGPFWTDFSVLDKAEAALADAATEGDAVASSHPPPLLSAFVQVVGHTIHKGVIVPTRRLGAVGVDAGMYLGGRAFLVITPDARFHGWEKRPGKGGSWARRDLTAQVCDGADP